MRVLATAVLLAGCVSPSFVPCGDLACPSDRACDSAHHRCVPPDVLEVCVGQVDGAACSATDVTGFCVGGACLLATCGDGVVEPGEACDDGNTADGDGCNASCSSLEMCGNGVVDAHETCDDGNFLSHDGCDSTCHVETLGWDVRVIGIVPPLHGQVAYDPNLARVITIDDTTTLAWSGTTWSLVATNGPSLIYSTLVTDAARSKVLALSLSQLYEWDGVAWTPRAMTNPPPDNYEVVAASAGKLDAYDRVGAAWSFDTATATWTALPTPPAPLAGANVSVVYSPPNDAFAVLQDDGTTQRIDALFGGAWHTVPVSLPNAVLAYEPHLGEVIALTSNSTAIQAFTGVSFRTLAETLVTPMPGQTLVYDVARARTVVLGRDAVTDALAIDERDATTWSHVPEVPDSGPIEFDPSRGEMVMSSRGRLFAYDETRWLDLGAAPTRPTAYDPIRGTLVEFAPEFGPVNPAEPNYDFFVRDATGAWYGIDGTRDVITRPGYFGGNRSLTFDPGLRRFVYIQEHYSAELDSPAGSPDAITISPLDGLVSSNAPPNPLPPNSKTAAFFARENRVFAVDYYDGRCYELAGSTWNPTLSPGPAYTVVADPQRGTLIFLGAQHPTYERTDDVTWLVQDEPPIPGGYTSYVPTLGGLVLASRIGQTSVLARRRWTSASPSETCLDSVDADGDGLVGCADPDCWWACTPACPPYATCP